MKEDVVYLHTIKYYSATKRREILTFVAHILGLLSELVNFHDVRKLGFWGMRVLWKRDFSG